LLPDELEADVLVDQPQQVAFRNLIFQAEVIKQRFRPVVLPHHDQQPSENGDQEKHGKEFSPPYLPRFCRHLTANRGDFFNTHRRFHSLKATG
jgi:hypothetical protein